MKLALALVFASSALAAEYGGKYEKDARLTGVRAALPQQLAAARKAIPIEGAVRIELRDLGKKRNGVVARTVQDADGFVILLYTEPLVLRTHDVAATLRHELVHCLQKERWGARGEVTTPLWIKEGMAVYLAGQLKLRERTLAAHVGREPAPADATVRLVNGLDGRHTLLDYAEDAAAFAGVEKRHGKKKALAFVDALLTGMRLREATVRVLGEREETFVDQSRKYATERIDPLVRDGRAELLALRAKVEAGDFSEALALPQATGVYAVDDAYYRARALHGEGKTEEALKLLRKRILSAHVRRTTLLAQAIRLELSLLAALDRTDEHAAALARAKLDLGTD